MKVKFFTVLMLAAALFMSACGKSDADLTKAATDKLAADKVTGVTVAVKDGVATLTGEVADQAVKAKAEASVKSVEGIKSVTNNCTLKPLPVATPAATDPALTGKLNEAMKKAGVSGLTIDVVNGKATIKGTVPAAKYAQVVMAINESGITGWDNQITKGN
ncbi:MAG TPA: BON domain-containing protein [Pyrinomonadaceae bacterium]|nr:BON domain-containing protein [Pyrinomonadaceae bacterium]